MPNRIFLARSLPVGGDKFGAVGDSKTLNYRLYFYLNFPYLFLINKSLSAGWLNH